MPRGMQGSFDFARPFVSEWPGYAQDDSNRGAIPRRGLSAPRCAANLKRVSQRETWGNRDSLAQAGRRDFGFSSALLRYFLPYCLLPFILLGEAQQPVAQFLKAAQARRHSNRSLAERGCRGSRQR